MTYAVGGPWGETGVALSADLLVTLNVSFGQVQQVCRKVD
jgi:hypothetical protein